MYEIITLTSGEKMTVMKQLRSKYVRIELENKHSAFSAALCKIVFWNMKYVITVCEKMQRTFYLM